MSDSDGRRPGDLNHHGADDTIEIQRDPRLADDLLQHGSSDDAVAAWVEPAEDDEDYYQPPKKRSRVTTGLVVALIFMVGVLVGVTGGRALPQQRAPHVVYLLNDEGSSAPGVGPSGAPSGTPPTGSMPSPR